MTYGLQCEALRFVWRNESFRFRRFWPRNGQLPNGRESSGESRRPSCPKTLEVTPLAVSSRGAMGSIASRRAVREATNTCIAPLEALRDHSCGAQNDASGRKPRRKKVAQKRTQVVETFGARKLVQGAETGKRS
jgi:hypothetical protein